MIARRGAGPEPYVFHGTSQMKSPTDELWDTRIKDKDLNSENLAMASVRPYRKKPGALRMIWVVSYAMR
jgi:hypothetical protein